jgi:hypothetical protein
VPFPLQRRSTPATFRWCNAILVFSLHQVLLVLSVRCTELAMTRPRPRGRPRRGSPWKPRRPSITPSDSTSADSSPPRQVPRPSLSHCAPRSLVPWLSSRAHLFQFCAFLTTPQRFLPAQSLPATLRTTWEITLLLTVHPSGQVLVSLRALTECSSQRAWLSCRIWYLSFGKR